MSFCPQCGDEFQPGINECPDCRMKLTDHPKKVLKIKSTPLNLVTVGVYDSIALARLNKQKLETTGIQAWITESTTNNWNWFLNTERGGIKVKVEKARAADAARILENTPSPASRPQTCPKCGSSSLGYESFFLRKVWFSMRVVNTPWAFMFRICKNCGHTWPVKKS